jgi:hypothetical protein
METESEREAHRFGYAGMVRQVLPIAYRHTFPHWPTCVAFISFLHPLSPPFHPADVALNTQQAHEDYVGIICTKAVRIVYFLLTRFQHFLHPASERT